MELLGTKSRALLVRFFAIVVTVTLASCNPVASTSIGTEFHPGVSLSVSKATVTASNTEVSVDSKIDVLVSLFDENGAPFISNTVKIAATTAGGSSVGNFSSFTSNNDGTYTATFTGVTAGTTTTVAVTVDDTVVTGTMPQVIVTSNDFSLTESLLTVSASSIMTKTDATVTLIAKNPYAHQLEQGGLTVEFSNTGGTSSGFFSSVTDHHDGTYTATFTGVTAGTATTLRAKINGSYVTSTRPTVTVTGTSPNSFTGVSGKNQNVTVAHAAPLPFVVLVKDSGSNPLQGIVIDWAVISGGGTLSSSTATSDSSGNAQTTLTLSTVAGDVKVRATVRGAVPELSTDFTTTAVADAAATLVISQQPSSAVAATTISPTITISAKDIYGNIDKAFTNNVVATILTNAGGATLSGTTTQAAVQGVASFNDLSLNKIGTGYRLAFASAGLATVNSSSFNITAGTISAAQSVFVVSSSSIVKTGTSTITLTAKDGGGNLITSGGATITFTRATTGGQSTGTISAVTDHNDGTYTAVYTGTAKGTANTITSHINGGTVTSGNPTITVNNSTPTLTAISNLATATEDTAFSITYAALASAADEADIDTDAISFRIEAVSSGTLTKGGVAVTPGTTLISSGDTVVWTPAANANGSLDAFTVKASDGTALSTTAVQVKVTTTAVNDAPIISNIVDTSTNEDVAKAVTFTIGDVDGALTCTSSNLSMSSSLTGVVANASVVWSGTYPNCTATITPTANKFGAPTLTITVTDGTLTASDSFVLTINELGDEAQSMDFPFTALSDANYTFDPVKIDLTGGVAELSSLPQTDSSTNSFSGAAGVGAAWDATNNIVHLGSAGSCDGTTTNCAALDSSWTPQWSSIVGYWKLEGTVGSIANNASIPKTVGSNGTAGNANSAGLAYSVGHLGQGITFAGTDDTISLPAVLLDTAYTIAFWMKTSTDNHSVLFAQGSGWDRRIIISNGNLCGYLYNGGVQSICSTGKSYTDGNWHHVVHTFGGAAGGQKLYVDNVMVASGNMQTSNVTPTQITFGYGYSSGTATDYFIGQADDIALWNAGLTAAEISTLYDRQSAKYSGSLTSRTMDATTSGNWTTFGWTPSLPFYKALPDAGSSESQANYASLYSGSLMTGIVGLWHFDESSWNGTSGEVIDSSGNGHNGVAMGSFTTASRGKFNAGTALYDRVDDKIKIPIGAAITSYPFAFSVWAWRATTTDDNEGVVVIGKGTDGGKRFLLSLRLSNLVLEGYNGLGQGQNCWTSDTTTGWHHYVIQFLSASDFRSYRDGVLRCQTSATNVPLPSDLDTVWSGTLGNGWGAMVGNARIDELAVWSRALNINEIVQLYRRGANRIKYQVRSCSDSACTTGSPSWLGPDGTNQSYFSELYNTASNSLTGAVSNGLPTMTFSNFGSLTVAANRYFQYRAIMESDDANALCNYGAGAVPCSPELKSATVGPTHYATDATISNATVVDATSLSAFTHVIGTTNGCSSGVSYNLKAGSGSWYWWNAAKASDCTAAGAGAWCAADGTTAQSNSVATINTHASTFYSQTSGVGSIYFKAFLNSDGTTKCELDNVHLDGTQ